MVDIPVTSSEHSHIGSRTTKASQKSGKKLFSEGLAFGIVEENYFEGFIIKANHYRPNSSP